MEQDSTRCAECEGKNLLLSPQHCEVETLQQGTVAQEQNQEQDLTDAEQELEAEAEEEQEEEQPKGNTRLAPSPPVLMVTLVPTPAAAPPPKPSPAPVTVTLTAPAPPRPPPARSCSSANSSSSALSNDAAPHPPRRNERSYPCTVCNRPFGTRHNLKRHYMIHTGEKPFSCSKCRKPFREGSTLKKHMVTHRRERWYKCLRCPAKFQDYLHYTDHKATHAGTDAAQPAVTIKRLRPRSSDSEDGDSSVEDWLECCECQCRFTQLDEYTAHLKQHDLEQYGMSVDDLDDEEDQDVDVA